ITAAAQREHLPCGPVYTVDQLFDDPSYRARGFFVEIDHPVAGVVRYPGAPALMSEGGWEVRRPAPLLGQHPAEVFGRRLRLSPEDRGRLRGEGVLYRRRGRQRWPWSAQLLLRTVAAAPRPARRRRSPAHSAPVGECFLQLPSRGPRRAPTDFWDPSSSKT